MESHLTMYITLVVTSGVLSVFLCIYAFSKRKHLLAARQLALLTALQSIYIFGFAFELSSDSLDEIKRWIAVEYIGIAFTPVVGLLLVLRYIGRTISRAAAAVLFVIPSITLILVATNDLHGLFYKLIYLRENTPSPMADMVIGKWYIVHGAYTFGSLLAGGIMLLRQWKKTNKAHRKHLVTLAGGQFIPMIASFLYLMGITPYGMDIVPIVLCVTSAMYLWALLSIQMLRLSPIAKESLFESMREGVLVLDQSERLTDYNGAAKKMLPELEMSMIGLALDSVWRKLTGEDFPIHRGADGIQGHLQRGHGATRSEYEVRSSTIKRQGGEALGCLLMLIDVTEQRQLQEQLKQQAYYDALTGILNRARFIRQSRALLQEVDHNRHSASLILFDIDHFKGFNDTYGHETGDAVLMHTVSACRNHLPNNSLFARYGGEEFVVFMPASEQSEAFEAASRLRSAIEAATLETEFGSLTVTASFGVAAYRSGDTLEVLLREADSALYEAKRQGRNRVSVFHKDSPVPT